MIIRIDAEVFLSVKLSPTRDPCGRGEGATAALGRLVLFDGVSSWNQKCMLRVWEMFYDTNHEANSR